MSTQSERLDLLIQEHSSLSHSARTGSGDAQREQEARVTQIRRELVQIMQDQPPKAN